jgi:transposase
MAMTIVERPRPVVGGVDTHLDVHVAAVVDSAGGVLGVESFPTTPAGYRSMSAWMTGFGRLERVGIEGTGAYGIGLSRHFTKLEVPVIEVDRPNRQQRHRQGKSDQLDAIEAARGALSGRCAGTAKTRDGSAEALRVLLVARRSASSAKIQARVQLRHLMFTAPDDLRARYGSLSRARFVDEVAKMRPRPEADPVRYSLKLTAVTLARRVHALDDEIAMLDELIATIVKDVAPKLLAVYGVGIYSAAEIVVAAGDNPERIRNEAAFAHLCGVAPIPADSGKRSDHHRLNPGGNRHANQALWHIVLTRLGQREPRTVAYMQRRLAEGLTKRDVLRCLKRYVAREVFTALRR